MISAQLIWILFFKVATFEGWMEVMADAVDCREVDQQPAYEARFVVRTKRRSGLSLIYFWYLPPQQVQLLLLCHLHRLWVLLHAEPLHWCHHWQLQCFEEEVWRWCSGNVPHRISEELLHCNEEIRQEEAPKSCQKTNQWAPCSFLWHLFVKEVRTCTLVKTVYP